MLRQPLRPLLPLLMLGVLAGCGKNGSEAARNVTSPGGSTTSDPAMEEAAVAASMGEAPEMMEDGLMESGAETDLSTSSSSDEINAAILPVRFWRNIERVNRRFEFAWADTDSTGRPTTVVVTAHKQLLGTFNILAANPPADAALAGDEPSPTPRDTTLRLVRKRLDDHWVRRILLKRVAPPEDGTLDLQRVRWRVAATSGVKVTSRDAETRIVSLRVQAGPLDTTVTNPLELFRLRRILRLPADTRIQLTVTTERSDDVVVLYRGLGRFRFRNNGDNTYSGGFLTGWVRGVHHFGVNALSHGTLFDDALPYDSQAWALPYVIAPTQLAEYIPER